MDPWLKLFCSSSFIHHTGKLKCLFKASVCSILASSWIDAQKINTITTSDWINIVQIECGRSERTIILPGIPLFFLPLGSSEVSVTCRTGPWPWLAYLTPPENAVFAGLQFDSSSSCCSEVQADFRTSRYRWWMCLHPWPQLTTPISGPGGGQRSARDPGLVWQHYAHWDSFMSITTSAIIYI